MTSPEESDKIVGHSQREQHLEKRITVNAQTLKILKRRNFRKVCTVNGKQKKVSWMFKVSTRLNDVRFCGSKNLRMK